VSLVDAKETTRRAGWTTPGVSYRRAYNSAGTAYSDYETTEETQIPGSQSTNTVNLILCFLKSQGMYSVNPASAPYIATVDMAPCNKMDVSNKRDLYSDCVRSYSHN